TRRERREEKARRGEEGRRKKGKAGGPGRWEAGPEARSRPKPGARLPPSAVLAADGRHVRGRQRFGRRDLLVTSPATSAGLTTMPVGSSSPREREPIESAVGSAHGPSRLGQQRVGPKGRQSMASRIAWGWRAE